MIPIVSRLIGYFRKATLLLSYLPTHLVIFLLSLLWFSFLQPWGSFRDPDSFYHAKLTDIILHGTNAIGAQGTQFAHLFFLQNFPWLDLTLLSTNFVDQHLLYHLALVPFVAILGMFKGVQVATVIFASLFISAFYYLVRNLRLQHPELWTFLIAVSMPLSFRLSLGKATPFALSFFTLGLVSLVGARSSRPSIKRAEEPRPYKNIALAFLAGLGFALSHGGWILLLISQALFILGTTIFDYLTCDKNIKRLSSTLKNSILDTRYSILPTALGILLALLIHPNRAHLLTFLKVQVFQVAIATPTNIQLGLEWSPIAPIQLIANLGPLLMMGFIVVLGLLFAIRRPLELHRARTSVGLFIVLAMLSAATLKSSRMAEYLIPVLALWLGSLWTLVDGTKLKQECLSILKEQIKTKTSHAPSPRYLQGCVTFLAGIFLIVFIRDARGTFNALHEARPFSRLTSIVDTLTPQAQPGERIFHDRWDSFGELFALAPQFRYISGVDPTFLLAARPELAQAYEHATKDPVFPLPEPFQTRFSLIERQPTCRVSSQKILTKTDRAILCK